MSNNKNQIIHQVVVVPEVSAWCDHQEQLLWILKHALLCSTTVTPASGSQGVVQEEQQKQESNKSRCKRTHTNFFRRCPEIDSKRVDDGVYSMDVLFSWSIGKRRQLLGTEF